MTDCQAIEGVFVWGIQRCGNRGYRVIIEDGEAWIVCRAHYRGIARSPAPDCHPAESSGGTRDVPTE